jgi:hypothetical protein
MLRRARAEKRLVWIFGSPRSGSTWLLNLLAHDPAVTKVDEPGVGIHLGVAVGAVVGLPVSSRVVDHRRDAGDYFFAERHRDLWEGPLRELLLSRFAGFDGRWLAIKEPHGSDAADMILSALPRSRMIFLLRDGRDVVDSELAAVSEGGWGLRALGGHPPISDRTDYLRRRAETWRQRISIVKSAFDSHPPSQRMLVRYEDLLGRPVESTARIAEWLELDKDRLEEGVARLSFHRVENRGPREFARAASPGMWRENLSDGEQAVLEEMLGETLAELGY